jgi:AbrB family looped-hinge helix DNA binding protein
MDKVGRVSLPKTLRDRLRLAAGNTLPLEFEGDRITLRPLTPEGSAPEATRRVGFRWRTSSGFDFRPNRSATRETHAGMKEQNP